MTTNIDWTQEFAGFFHWCHPRLTEVLDASGVRELWLQGEAYRYFRRHRTGGTLCVYTNTHNKSDLAFYATDTDESPIAVVEIKLLGLDYQSKMLTGHSDLRPYVTHASGQRFVFDRTHADQAHPKVNSVLGDYKKLLVEPHGRRFLILVLNTACPGSGFGEAVQNVDFGGPGDVVHDRSPVTVTCWEIR
ncbi:MAG: hypothetical protein U0271_48660 [Polyangiaceae bacterium]